MGIFFHHLTFLFYARFVSISEECLRSSRIFLVNPRNLLEKQLEKITNELILFAKVLTNLCMDGSIFVRTVIIAIWMMKNSKIML
jgi:hypothetical protein